MSGQFEQEVKKFQWLLTEGYITPQELAFYSNFYDIETTTIINFEGNEILAPLFILARPSRFDQIKRELSQAEIADPYSKKFPVISLISLEKFINSLVNLKIPFYFFSLWLHRSYYDIPSGGLILLSKLINMANSSYKYIIKSYNIPSSSEELPAELERVVCHFKKMLGEKDNCDDNDWWKYNLWNKSTTTTNSTITRKEIEKLALKYNVSPICLQYVIMYNKNPCHLSSFLLLQIKSDLTSSSSS
ncbi:hypothetical protein [Sulfolobus monocaudavirus SMV4]|uniref:virion structural protein n=1 Tax=Sulfolobus monocaudavirus SMV4 TaxID=1732178 RepID=UPI00070663CA|nr:virion structural protein [Sulfolobus monocaudavirus SMV4]ALG97062.1 hypothetical protein [Sulfolobus monocaudavirus SMV4]